MIHTTSSHQSSYPYPRLVHSYKNSSRIAHGSLQVSKSRGLLRAGSSAKHARSSEISAVPSIEEWRGEFKFTFPYPERIDLVPLARSLPQGRFDYDLRHWVFGYWPSEEHRIYTILRNEKVTIDPSILPNHFQMWSDLKEATRMRNFSPLTYTTYLFWNQTFLKFKKCLPDFIQEEDFLEFQNYMIEARSIRSRSISSLQSALTFYYRDVRRQFYILPFPKFKKEKLLPDILNTREVLRLIDSPSNNKHKILLGLAYSAGLRVSEAVSIKLSDLDLDRNTLLIKQSKGKKDRIVPLSLRIKEDIQNYLCERHKKTIWLFPNDRDYSKHIASRTAEKIFTNAKEKSRITKKVSFHSLRHAYATHLLENGTDIRVIQNLLGHSSLRTTEIYTHITQAIIDRIKSPLDTLPRE